MRNSHLSDAIISSNDVQTALRSCKRGKACGIDNVYYEHYIYGGDMVTQVLSKLFTAMLIFSHTIHE